MKRLLTLLLSILLISCTTNKYDPNTFYKINTNLCETEKEQLQITINVEEDIEVYQNHELNVNDFISVDDGLGNNLSFETTEINTSKLGEYTFTVIVTPPDKEAITKKVTYNVVEVPNPYITNGKVNFDKFFKYAFVTSTYSHDAVNVAQSYIDRGYLTELVGGFYHHNTDTMLGCVHSCTEGMHVIINGIEYISQGVQFVANCAGDQSLIAWCYNGVPKIITCVQRNRTCTDRWVVVLEKA